MITGTTSVCWFGKVFFGIDLFMGIYNVPVIQGASKIVTSERNDTLNILILPMRTNQFNFVLGR